MAGTLIPRNNFRKNSRELIDSAWKAGNRRPQEGVPEEDFKPRDFPDRRTQMARKVEEIAARRTRARSTRFKIFT